MSFSPTKVFVTLTATVIAIFCCTQESNAQRRGFRIGNILQAGGGQGFRLGGNRVGMQFGGGQGAIIGGQNVGMRFGNGQGARFGSRDFGMQFGGGRGTQFGRLTTQSTYYNGTIQNQSYRQPMGITQPIVGQPFAGQAIQPQVVQPITLGYATNVNQGVVTSNYIQPTTSNFGQGVTQTDIARVSRETEITEAVAPPTPTDNKPVAAEADQTLSLTAPLDPKVHQIQLSLPASEQGPFKYKLNGSEFTIQPGETVLMAAGEAWKIEFAAGGELGGREAILKEAGTYAFEKSDTDGWVLMKN